MDSCQQPAPLGQKLGDIKMSFGKMNTFIDIIGKSYKTDTEGFKTEITKTLKTIRAYREGRHGNEKWANRATFSDATDLFRFRVIPGFSLTTDMKIKCGENIYDITSIEDVKGRKMYIEVLAKEVKPSG